MKGKIKQQKTLMMKEEYSMSVIDSDSIIFVGDKWFIHAQRNIIFFSKAADINVNVYSYLVVWNL